MLFVPFYTLLNRSNIQDVIVCQPVEGPLLSEHTS